MSYDTRDRARIEERSQVLDVQTVGLWTRREIPTLKDKSEAIAIFKSCGWTCNLASSWDTWHRACCPLCKRPARQHYSLMWQNAIRVRIHMVNVHGWRFRVSGGIG